MSTERPLVQQINDLLLIRGATGVSAQEIYELIYVRNGPRNRFDLRFYDEVVRQRAENARMRTALTKLIETKWPNEMNDKDMFGVRDFRKWFDSVYPVPRTKAQKGNRKGKENVAYGAWVKCEELYGKILGPVLAAARAALEAKP